MSKILSSQKMQRFKILEVAPGSYCCTRGFLLLLILTYQNLLQTSRAETERDSSGVSVIW